MCQKKKTTTENKHHLWARSIMLLICPYVHFCVCICTSMISVYLYAHKWFLSMWGGCHTPGLLEIEVLLWPYNHRWLRWVTRNKHKHMHINDFCVCAYQWILYMHIHINAAPMSWVTYDRRGTLALLKSHSASSFGDGKMATTAGDLCLNFKHYHKKYTFFNV